MESDAMTTTTKRKRVAPPKSAATRKAGKKAKPRTDAQTEKKALIDSLCGSLSWVDYSVDEYLREKREEVERENGN